MSWGDPGGKQEYVYLSGKARWAHVILPDPKWNKYKIDINLDNASLAEALELKKRGIKNNISKDDEGYWITVSSPHRIDTRRGPQIIQPPAVVNPDGSDWDSRKGIGNGSDVTVKVWLRKYKNPQTGKDELAARLYGIMVNNYVEFNPKKDFEDDKKRVLTDGLKENVPKAW